MPAAEWEHHTALRYLRKKVGRPRRAARHVLDGGLTMPFSDASASEGRGRLVPEGHDGGAMP
jgi:hypothetical protein